MLDDPSWMVKEKAQLTALLIKNFSAGIMRHDLRAQTSLCLAARQIKDNTSLDSSVPSVVENPPREALLDAGAESLSDNFHEDPFSASAIKLAIENLFPGTEV